MQEESRGLHVPKASAMGWGGRKGLCCPQRQAEVGRTTPPFPWSVRCLGGNLPFRVHFTLRAEATPRLKAELPTSWAVGRALWLSLAQLPLCGVASVLALLAGNL